MERLSSSFRDPSGFVFKRDGEIYRQINDSYLPTFTSFIASGLYDRLVDRNLLVAHEMIEEVGPSEDKPGYKVIKPTQIPFISYPYEWAFCQLKEAAMTTLRIQSEALKFGFVLKDASAYNIQFLNSKAVFVDTLSFAEYVEGEPWVAYKQFCQHFLAPLALMAHTDIELSKLLISHIDGIPLPLASKLLPLKTRLNYSLASHVHLHSRLQQDYGDSAADKRSAKASKAHVSKRGLVAMTESLAKAVIGLNWKMPKTEWGDYYQNTNYSAKAGEEKRGLVAHFLSQIPEDISVIQDFGANTGEFSRIASQHCELVVSQDIDPVAVELNVKENLSKGCTNILPLVQDFSSPSPAIGWGNAERDSFIERSRGDVLLVLALIHHLAISNNVPLEDIAKLYSTLAPWLIIEFVPKSDSQVERLLATREDIFSNYTKAGFEQSFGQYFTIVDVASVPESARHLYLMRCNSHD